MSDLVFEPTPIAGVLRVRRTRRVDARGFLSRLYGADAFRAAGADFPIAQVNHTRTAAPGTVRGMHYQHAPHAETKLVTCVRGAIHDVALDLRRGSRTFLRWFALELRAEADDALLIPPGCAHGFQTLAPDSEIVYLHSAGYAPQSEGAVHVLDPRAAIAWPRPVEGLSERDRAHPWLAADFDGIDPHGGPDRPAAAEAPSGART
jgi:dTDP-4-dehydrorhamnose 3,5-epimerase